MAGEYKIIGIMYDKTSKQPLRNKEFIINNKIIKTDANAQYSIVIKWSIICQSNLNWFQKQNFNKKNNVNRITFKYDSKHQTIKNKWRKYGLKLHWEKDKKNYIKNIYW